MKRSVLFVDDEPRVLRGLERMLRSVRRKWKTAFVKSGQEALDLLEKESFDVVVSDMRMPGMDGVQLLGEVKKRYPHMVRIALSGHSDERMILETVKLAHQYLAKPCDADTLISTIEKACDLRELLKDETLLRLVAGMDSLPSLPSLYAEILEELESPEASVVRIGEIISRDVGMTAKILQMVNSAFFGLPRRVSNPAQAITMLGIETVKALVLGMQIFSRFDVRNVEGFSLARLWEHSLRVALCSKAIAKAETEDTVAADEAFMAGLLHDAGKPVLASNYPSEYGEALRWAGEEGHPSWKAEQRFFGATHAEVGAYLLGLWGFPDVIVETLAYHHHPDRFRGEGFHHLTAVHVGNTLEHTLAGEDKRSISKVSKTYVHSLGLTDRVPRWFELCREVCEGEKN